ncbi:MAG: HD domain-containing phosphohydrolase [Planctomycetota bacterium]
MGTEPYTRNHSSNRLLDRIGQLNRIGVALSIEDDPLSLLRSILDGAMSLCSADGGTIYLLDDERTELRFTIMRTRSLGIACGAPDEAAIDLPPVPLATVDGHPNRASVVACAVLDGVAICFDDAYAVEGFDFSGTRAFDQRTGYRSRSMLTVPMRNHEHEMIGVLQLLNAQAGERVVSFSRLSQQTAESLASQAATALTRHELVTGMETLFEGFVRLIADAIDEKSAHTGNHCRRVPDIVMRLAEACCAFEDGPLADFDLDEHGRYELHIAALLHDCGKLATPDWIMDKATKLQRPFDRIGLIETRYAVLQREAELRQLRAGVSPDQVAVEQARLQATYADELAFLARVNSGGEAISEEDRSRLYRIAARRWHAHDGSQRPLLDDEELDNLLVARGTLNPHERSVIEDHINTTIRMLESLPYPRQLRRVPEYAAGHHERMDGGGYPRGLTREQMSWPARMMGLADVFEALTAADRPYKKALNLTQSLTILGNMVEDGHIDPDLFAVFIHSRVWQDYAQEHMRPEQCDEVDIAALPGLPSGAE